MKVLSLLAVLLTGLGPAHVGDDDVTLDQPVLDLFLTPVTRDLALTAADFTLAVAVQNIIWGLSQAPVGAIADRFGLRATMMAGATIYVVGLGVMAAAGGATTLIVSGGLIGVALSCTASSLGLTRR